MKKTQRFVLRGSILLLAIAFAGTLRTSAAEANPLLVHPLAVDGCAYHCRDCGTAENPYHDIVVAVTNEHKSSHLENCNSGSCASHECEGGGIEEDSLTFVSQETSAAELVGLLRDQPALVRFNAERGALQLYCTEGRLIAHLPLRADRVHDLRAAHVNGAF